MAEGGDLNTLMLLRLSGVICAHRYNLNHFQWTQRKMNHRSSMIEHDSSATVEPHDEGQKSVGPEISIDEQG